MWYAAYSVDQNWKPARVPKLSLLDLRLEKEGLTRFETYKDERRAINLSPVKCRGLSLTDPDQQGTLIYCVQMFLYL